MNRAFRKASRARANLVEALEPRRLFSGGLLDPTFGTGGIVQPPGGAGDIAVAPDGKTYVISSDGALLGRLNVNGSPDSSFGSNGTVRTPFVAGSSRADLLIQPNGKILVGALSSHVFHAMPFVDVQLARYLPDGSRDLAFGSDGHVFTTVQGAAPGELSVQHGAGGVIFVSEFSSVLHAGFPFRYLLVYTANGAPEVQFQGGQLNLDLTKTFNSVIGPDAQGQLLVEGSSGMERLTPDGLVDPTFSPIQPMINGVAGGIGAYTALSTDNFILAGGFGDGLTTGSAVSWFVNGRPSPFFGVAGTVTLPGFTAAKVKFLCNGQILVAGFGNSYYELLNPDGTLDTSFFGGTPATDLNGSSRPEDVKLQPDGELTVTTSTGAVERLLTQTTTLKSNGTLLVSGTGNDDAISVTSDGSVLTTNVNGDSSTFPVANVQKLIVLAGPGDDHVNIGPGVIGASIQGGQGNDTLLGGDGNDTLRGGSGNDSLSGAAGDDLFFTADGQADTLDGGTGTNTAHTDAVDVLTNIQVNLVS